MSGVLASGGLLPNACGRLLGVCRRLPDVLGPTVRLAPARAPLERFLRRRPRNGWSRTATDPVPRCNPGYEQTNDNVYTCQSQGLNQPIRKQQIILPSVDQNTVIQCILVIPMLVQSLMSFSQIKKLFLATFYHLSNSSCEK